MEIMIPVKPNSKRLPGKNQLPSRRGLPLYAETILAAQEAFPDSPIHVYLADSTLASQVTSLGAIPKTRTRDSLHISIDEFVDLYRGDDDLLVLQPDQQGYRMVEAMKYFVVIAAKNQRRSSVAVVADSGIIYLNDGTTVQPRSESPIFLRERGWRYYPKGVPANSFETVPLPSHLFDINTPGDYISYLNANKSKYPTVRIVYLQHSHVYGSGHERRARQIQKSIRPFTADIEMVPVLAPGEMVSGFADITIIDALDTTKQQVLNALRHSKRVITFEDQGLGSAYADATINALYGTSAPGRYTGARYALIRPEFALSRIRGIENRGSRSGVLVTFGGTDMNHLSERVIEILSAKVPELSVIPPPGRPLTRLGKATSLTSDIAPLLAEAKIVVTSGGRTLLEAAAVGTPAIVLAQNEREATHAHLGPSHGNVYLGYGAQVTSEALISAVRELRNPSAGYWDDLHLAALRSVDGKGWWRVLNIILGREGVL